MRRRPLDPRGPHLRWCVALLLALGAACSSAPRRPVEGERRGPAKKHSVHEHGHGRHPHGGGGHHHHPHPHPHLPGPNGHHHPY